MNQFIQCGLCSLGHKAGHSEDGAPSFLRVCSGGCGLIAHNSCFPADSDEINSARSSMCPNCIRKAPSANSTIVLARLFDLTNLCLRQTELISSLTSDLASTKEQLSLLGKLVAAKVGRELSDSQNLPFGPNQSSRPRTLSGPSSTPVVNNAGTAQFDRKRRDVAAVDTPNKKFRSSSSRILVGVGSSDTSSSLKIPSVKKVVRRRIFVSRIDPSVELPVFATAVRGITKMPISVIKLKSNSVSAQRRFSSFVVYADECDHEVLISPSTWSEGTLFKNFSGYLYPDQMDSRFDSDVTEQGNHIDGVPDLRSDKPNFLSGNPF